MNGYELVLIPRRNGVPAGRTCELDVLVRLQAPDAPPEGTVRRAHSLNIAFVIDRSGSMSGPPLREAKRCVAEMFGRLEARDRAACVVYDDEVRLLVPSTPVTDPARFQRALYGIESGGTTNLHGGWLAGAEQLADGLRDGEIARAVLLSDGNANRGLTDTDAIASQCEALANAGVSTSTYGLGRDFNEDLMIAMARKGGGNHYYGETATDLIEPFNEEFDLLQDLAARSVRLRVSPAPGLRARVLNDYAEAGPEVWRLPDLAYASEGWALVRLQVTRDALDGEPALEQVRLMDVEVELVDTGTRERRFLRSDLRVPVVQPGAFDDLPHDELVASCARELASAALQRQIRDAVRVGDWATAERLLAQAEADADDHAWLREMLRTFRYYLEQRDQMRVAKEAAFGASRLQRRLLEKNASDNDAFDGVAEETRRSYLRRKTWQGRGRGNRPSD